MGQTIYQGKGKVNVSHGVPSTVFHANTEPDLTNYNIN